MRDPFELAAPGPPALGGARPWEDLTGELGRALRRGELRLHYQPTVDLRDGTVVGVEALLRWAHPDRGEIDPEAFLPLAEDTPVMVPLGMWVVEQAVEHAARWRRHLGRPLRVWVNLAASQLSAVAEISSTLVRALEQHDATPDLIGFEVTESTLMHSLDDAVSAIRSLRELGVDVALDDFGTGYSSLAYLRRLPVTTVKIDRSFVSGMGGSLADAAIVEAVIDLAHALGHGVLAEGVEERRQAEDLLALGADRAQGFYFSPPLPAEEVEELLALPWCGVKGPEGAAPALDRRADRLPGAGGPRARLLLTALDSVSDAVVVFCAVPEPRRNPIVYVNPAFEAQTGMRWDDVVGQEGAVLDPPGPEPVEVAHLLAATSSGRAITVELPARRADGSAYPCEVTLSPITDDKGIVTHWLALRRDLTARRALEAERSRFQLIIERASSGAVITDVAGEISYANPAACELVGMDRLDLLALRISDLYDPPLDAVVEASIRSTVLAQGSWIGTHTLCNRRTGELVPVEIEVQLVLERHHGGRGAYLATLLHDRRPELRRQEMRELAGRFAARVLERPPRQSLQELSTLVHELGPRLGAHLCFVDLIDQRRGVLVTEAIWEATRRHDERLEVPLERLPTWLGELSRGEAIVLDGTETELVPGHHERVVAFGDAPQLAQITVPLRVDGQLLGLLGLCMAPGVTRAWTDDERELMRSLGETAANLVARHRVEEAEARRAAYDQVAFAVAQRALDLGPAEFLAALPAALADLGRALECHHVVAGRLVGDRFVELGTWAVPECHEGAGHDGSAPAEAAGGDAGGGAAGPSGSTGGGAADPSARTGGDWPDLAELADAADAAGAAGAVPLVVPDVRRTPLGGLDGAGMGVPGGAGCMVVVPLMVARRSIGVLAAITHHRRRWADDEVSVVRAVGETVAFALERRRVDEALARSEARLTALLANSADIIVVVDREGVVHYVSPALTELLGVEPSTIVTRHFRDFLHPDDHALAAQGLVRAEGTSQTERLRIAMPNDAGYRWFEARSNDRYDEDLGGLVVVLRDIEQRVRAEEAAAHRLALEQFTLGVSRLDAELGSVAFLERLGDLLADFGPLLGVDVAYVDAIEPTEPNGLDGHEDAVLCNVAGWCVPGWAGAADLDPVPVGQVAGWVTRLLELSPVVASDEIAAEATRPRARKTPGALLAYPLAAEGELIGVLGVEVLEARRDWTSDEINTTHLLADVIANAMAKARVDEALRASEARFRLLAEQAADVVTLAGPEGDLRYLSPSIRELLGYEPEDLLGARLLDLVHPDDQDRVRHAMGELGELELFSQEIRLARHDGSWLWVANSGRAVRNSEGRLVEVRGSLRDVSERKRLEAELARRATHDPLTGLANRALLAERLERSSPADEGLCLLLIDLDGFKAVNDQHGHTAGDQTLQVIASRLRQVVRPGDLVARYGGDEFIVVSDGINVPAAIALGDRIVASLSRPIVVDGLAVILGASVGVAVADGRGIAADRLLRAADSAMYRAKREGKGTVRLAAVRA